MFLIEIHVESIEEISLFSLRRYTNDEDSKIPNETRKFSLGRMREIRLERWTRKESRFFRADTARRRSIYLTATYGAHPEARPTKIPAACSSIHIDEELPRTRLRCRCTSYKGCAPYDATRPDGARRTRGIARTTVAAYRQG